MALLTLMFLGMYKTGSWPPTWPPTWPTKLVKPLALLDNETKPLIPQPAFSPALKVRLLANKVTVSGVTWLLELAYK